MAYKFPYTASIHDSTDYLWEFLITGEHYIAELRYKIDHGAFDDVLATRLHHFLNELETEAFTTDIKL